MRAKNIEEILVYMHTGQWFGFGGKEKTYANLIIHSDDEKPTQEWLETELKSQQDAYDNDISRKRKEEYPSIDELVVALWEGVVEERMAAITSLEGKRQAVKTKHPKG
tara:strand:+ start:57 stop:380 length:324 start_codon:yes stop_codon:yes gene_type:complete